MNFTLVPESGFAMYKFHTTSLAFKVNNIVVGVSNRAEVPEPGLLALLGAGFLGLVATRRRKHKS